MKRKVYNSTIEDLLEFIVDIDNKLSVDVKCPEVITRYGKGVSYDSILKECTSTFIVPKYNVCVDQENKKCTIGIDIQSLSLLFSLKYIDRSCVCGFKYIIPSDRLFIKINIKDLEKYLTNFYAAEKFVENYVEKYFKAVIKYIFEGQMFDESDDNWILKTPKHTVNLIQNIF